MRRGCFFDILIKYMEFIFQVAIFVFGLCIGSFLNVVILRLEKSESLGGRSYCPNCKHQLAWFDLIPVASFLLLAGRCRYCKARISIQYPLVEVVTALLFLLISNFQFSISNTIFLFYIASSLIVIFAYDLKHYLIPDKVLFPAIIVAVIFRFWDFWYFIGNWKLGIGNYALAILIASGFFLLIFLVSRGRWIGFGDVKLAILLGLLVGFPNILVALLLAFWIGAIVGIAMMLLKKKGMKSEMPFAPFLIAGTFLALFWGTPMISWYSHFLLL